MSKKSREFSAEFRIAVAKRIDGGESVSKIQLELKIKRSVLYRWRDAYRKQGVAGLQLQRGRPPGVPNPPSKPGASETELLRQQIAGLEQKVGRQAMQLDFFKQAFKRIKVSSQNSNNTGATASTNNSVG